MLNLYVYQSLTLFFINTTCEPKPSWTNQGESNIRPPSCTTPRQPTVYLSCSTVAKLKKIDKPLRLAHPDHFFVEIARFLE